MMNEIIKGIRLTVLTNSETITLRSSDHIIVRAQDATLRRQYSSGRITLTYRYTMRINEQAKSELHGIRIICVLRLTRMRQIIRFLGRGGFNTALYRITRTINGALRIYLRIDRIILLGVSCFRIFRGLSACLFYYGIDRFQLGDLVSATEGPQRRLQRR